MTEHNKTNINEINNMTIAIADNLQNIRASLANLRGMGEYMKKYSKDSEAIQGMAQDCEKTCKQAFSLLVKTEDIIRQLKKQSQLEERGGDSDQ